MVTVQEFADVQARRFIDRSSAHSTLIARKALHRKTATGARAPDGWELRLLAEVPRGALAIDVGAHIGVMSLLLSKRYTQVVALEPNSFCVNRLQRTMPDNVFIIGAAAGDQGGAAELRVPRHSGRAVAALGSLVARADNAADAQTQRVVKLRLDDVVSDPVDFLKIDVEGFEPEVLAGAQRILSGRPVVLIEAEHRHRANAPSLIAEALATHDLTGLFVLNGTVKDFKEFDPAVHQAAARTIDGRTEPGYVNNFLFVPSERRDFWADVLGRAAAPAMAKV
jgi:FkbM family methyltransferase